MVCLLVHGWMVTERVWSRFAPKLHSEVRAPSLIPADPSSTTLDTLAERVLADAPERFHLVGHSMGGRVAQLVAARAPERVLSLALVNPVPLSGLAFPSEVAHAFRTCGGNRAAQGAIVDQSCLQLSAADREAMLDDAASIDPAWIARALDLFITGEDTAKLANISCPTLVVATDDPFLPPAFLEQAVVQHISSARLTTLRGPGHYPQVEQPDALAALINDFHRDAAR